MNGTPNIRNLATALQMTEEVFEFLPAASRHAAQITSMFESAFPIAPWGRIDWTHMPNHQRQAWDFDSGLSRGFEELIGPYCQPETLVYVMWTDAMKPILATTASAVVRHITRILEVDWDTWIFDRRAAWCVEAYHEGELCAGVAPVGR